MPNIEIGTSTSEMNSFSALGPLEKAWYNLLILISSLFAFSELADSNLVMIVYNFLISTTSFTAI